MMSCASFWQDIICWFHNSLATMTSYQKDAQDIIYSHDFYATTATHPMWCIQLNNSVKPTSLTIIPITFGIFKPRRVIPHKGVAKAHSGLGPDRPTAGLGPQSCQRPPRAQGHIDPPQVLAQTILKTTTYYRLYTPHGGYKVHEGLGPRLGPKSLNSPTKTIIYSFRITAVQQQDPIQGFIQRRRVAFQPTTKFIFWPAYNTGLQHRLTTQAYNTGLQHKNFIMVPTCPFSSSHCSSKGHGGGGGMWGFPAPITTPCRRRGR